MQRELLRMEWGRERIAGNEPMDMGGRCKQSVLSTTLYYCL